MTDPLAGTLEKLEKRLRVGEGLSMATDPPQRYFTDEQLLLKECRDQLAAALAERPQSQEEKP